MAIQSKLANDHVIIQWNCHGLINKYTEIQILIQLYSPAVFCLQETLLQKGVEYKIKGYTPYIKSLENSTNGVAIYVKDSIPQSKIELNSALQALAVRVTIQGKTFIISNHYTPHSQSPSKRQFQSIINKFNLPYLMCGDFNAHNILWTSIKNNPRGDIIEELVEENDLIILNRTEPTRYDQQYNSWSNIDLQLCHPELYLDLNWEVLEDRHRSDHCPIKITIPNDLSETDKIPQWNFKTARWDKFQEDCKNKITDDILEGTVHTDKMAAFTEKLLEIADDNINKTSAFHNKPSKPWFDKECQEAKKERNNANRNNRRYPSIPNAIECKRVNAKTKRLFRRKKRESWRNYTASINSKTSSKQVWNMIRKITGKNTNRRLHHVKDSNGQLLTNKEDIANELANTIENNSSSNNYSSEFKNIKNKEERKPLNFKTNEKFAYNKRFKLRDLKRSLRKARDTLPGSDQIHYQILKHLPDETLKVLLNIINEYWENQTFPENWKEAIILPIPKPDKNHSNPNNYRPIALTSCICKTVERMVNERLIHYLEKNNILSKFQAGFRTQRSTIDQLVRLETYIKDALAKGEHAIAIFFDLKKAYDTTWKYGIMRDLHNMGLRGNLPIFIQNFLSERVFTVLLGTSFSEMKNQEEGVPQGAILSTTLFNVKLNDIAKQLTPGVNCSLYVDDFKLLFRSSSLRHLKNTLNTNIERIVEWTRDNGFTVECGKTKAMLFCCCGQKKKCNPLPVLQLGNTQIDYVDEHKFFGLIWDSKLNWQAHIKYLKCKCQSPLNLIKMLSYSNWGSDTKTLLKLYRALVRSILDYGSIVYASAKKDDLKPLDVIHNQGIRLCLGAFRSSPIESLMAEANELPLNERRYELSMRYALKIKGNKRNPTYESVFDTKHDCYYESNTITDSFGLFVRKQFDLAEIDTDKIMQSKVPDFPVWDSEPNDVSFVLSEFDKKTTSPDIFQSKFNEIISEYDGYLHLYTDGSKQNEKAAFAVHTNIKPIGFRLPNYSQIFTAETDAIYMALEMIKYSRRQNQSFVIFSDSKSLLDTIYSQESKNPLVVRTLDKIQYIKASGKVIKFCWVPGHVGIQGNEAADKKAKEALEDIELTHYKIPYTDFIPKTKTYIKNMWQQRYDNHHLRNRSLKIHEIMPVIKPFYTNGLNRKDEVKIHRLRIGHTRLTHSYLMEGRRQEPQCHFCTSDLISVRHLMLDCQFFNNIRRRFFSVQNLKELFDTVDLRKIINFLKASNIYNEI